MAMDAKRIWFLMYSVELHSLVWMCLPAPAPPRAADAPVALAILDEPPSPGTIAPAMPPNRDEGGRASAAAAAPRRSTASDRLPRHVAAAASPAVAAPSATFSVPVATASAFPGGLTSPMGTSDDYVSDLGEGDGVTDLTTPAHLDGNKAWSCEVAGVPPLTVVQARALVRIDGTAETVSPMDPGAVSGLVLKSALPCALRARYVAGTDRDGRRVKKWSRPFRIMVIGS
jgi:hypothetical protein